MQHSNYNSPLAKEKETKKKDKDATATIIFAVVNFIMWHQKILLPATIVKIPSEGQNKGSSFHRFCPTFSKILNGFFLYFETHLSSYFSLKVFARKDILRWTTNWKKKEYFYHPISRCAVNDLKIYL